MPDLWYTSKNGSPIADYEEDCLVLDPLGGGCVLFGASEYDIPPGLVQPERRPDRENTRNLLVHIAASRGLPAPPTGADALSPDLREAVDPFLSERSNAAFC